MPGGTSFGLPTKCGPVWLSFLNRSCRPAPQNWAGRRNNGRHDMVFQYSSFYGNWLTILISFFGAIGSPEVGTPRAGRRTRHKLQQEIMKGEMGLAVQHSR